MSPALWLARTRSACDQSGKQLIALRWGEWYGAMKPRLTNPEISGDLIGDMRKAWRDHNAQHEMQSCSCIKSTGVSFTDSMHT